VEQQPEEPNNTAGQALHIFGGRIRKDWDSKVSENFTKFILQDNMLTAPQNH